MCRRVFMWIVLVSLVGCQGPYSPFAPYGPTQVPPPPTGSATRPDPYYRRAPSRNADRLSRRRFTSDQRGPQTNLADRRGNAASSDDEPTYDGGLPNRQPRASRNVGQGEFDTPPRNDWNNGQSSTGSLRPADNLGWRSPEPTYRQSYVAPAGGRSGQPRPRFGY